MDDLCDFQKVKDIEVNPKPDPESGGAGGAAAGSRLRRGTAHALWFLSTTRNILVVLLCAALAYYFDTQRQAPFVLTGTCARSYSIPSFFGGAENHQITPAQGGAEGSVTQNLACSFRALAPRDAVSRLIVLHPVWNDRHFNAYSRAESHLYESPPELFSYVIYLVSNCTFQAR